MIIPEINLRLHAEIDGFAQHAAARAWWEAASRGKGRVGLTSVSLFGCVRIATNRRVFAKPMSVTSAVSRVERWIKRPQANFVVPGRRHLEMAFDLLGHLGTGGNRTTSVQLAALAIEDGAEIASNDLDFGRFAGLRWRNPLA